ncbi:hypothetical protein [Chryseobacterium nematophagum]|nr:hypothetical protein [Chryseobacterium nematophagum]
MRKSFISGFILIALASFLSSCRNNDILMENEIPNSSSKFQLISKTISLDQSKHKIILNNTLKKVQRNIQTMNLLGKVVDGDIYIDTDNITYIENGLNYHTYTFNLVRDHSSDHSPLENLVLTPLPDGTYKELLVSYNLTKQEKQILKAGGYIDIRGKETITELSDGILTSASKGSEMTSCGFVETYTIRGCSDVHNGISTHNENNTSEWGNCKADRKPGVHMTMTYRCDFINDTNNPGTGGGDGGSIGDGSGTYVPGGGSTTPCNGNGIATGPFNPTENLGEGNCTGIPTSPTVTLSTFFRYIKSLPTDLQNLINNPENKAFFKGLQSCYDANNSEEFKNIIKWGLQFKQNNTITWEEFQPIFLAGYNFLTDNYADTTNPEQIFTRIKNLNDALIQNPNLLLDIPCNELPKWKDLAQHQIPQSVKDKLRKINNNTSWYQDEFSIQNLDFASGASVNMDLFPVKITNMPNKLGTNKKYTPTEFFDFFRRNINLFAEKFSPLVSSSYGVDDAALWFSNNPLGSLMHIEIPGDNGTVICSGYNVQAWVFTTVQAPFNLDGMHPVSGNRLFGYYTDHNGFMYIYTRGVDRFTKPYGGNILTYLTEKLAFSKADELWEGMQIKLEAYINNTQNGGSAEKLEPVRHRPIYSKITKYLKNKASLSSLGCN